jgi:mannosyltransferase
MFGIAVLAAVLRIMLAGEKGFDPDEIRSIFYARLGWAPFFGLAIPLEANMSLYFFLLRFWRLAGESEVVIRSLSVAAGAATIPALYLLGRRLFSSRVGLVAAFLIGINTYHIQFSQYARSYSLLVFLVTVSSLLFVYCLEQPSWKRWVGYLLVSTLSVYSHLFAAFVLIAQWISVGFLGLRNVPWRGWLASVLCMSLLLLPLGIIVLLRTPTWATWIPVPTFRDIRDVYAALSGGRGGPTGLLLLGFYCTCCVIALWQLFQRRGVSGRFHPLWRYGFICVWLLLPVLMAFAISQLKPIFITFYLIICLPPFVLLAAAGLDAMPKPVLIGGLILVAILSSRETYKYYADPVGRDDFRGATRYILSHAKAGDGVAFFSLGMEAPFQYYRKRLEGALKPPPLTILSIPYTLVTTDRRLVQLLELLRDSARSGPVQPLRSFTEVPSITHRVWLLLSYDWNTKPGTYTFSRSLQASFAGKYCSVTEHRFQNVRVLLYASPHASGGCH